MASPDFGVGAPVIGSTPGSGFFGNVDRVVAGSGSLASISISVRSMPQGDAAVRRGAHRERLEEEAELRLRLLLARSRSCGTRAAGHPSSWIRKEPEPSSQPFQIRS